MKRLFVIVALCAVAASTHAASSNERIKIGGEGKVAFVNACNAPTEALVTAANKIGNMLMINIEVTKGTWKLAEAQKCIDATGANAAVFVVKDEMLPLSLVSLEAKWGVVNAAGLDGKSIEKETLRVATMILGGAASKYSASSMRPVFSKEDLAKKAGDIVTFDSIIAISSYLPELGIKPYRMMTRDDAIEEGLIKADDAAKK
jgi:hypothetical protein